MSCTDATEKKGEFAGGISTCDEIQIPEAADDVGLGTASAQIFRWLGNFLYENFSRW